MGIVCSDKCLDILGRRGLSHHKGILRIVFLNDLPNGIRIAKSLCTLCFRPYVYQHPALISPMKLAGDRIGKKIFRYPLRQCIGHGCDAFYKGKILQFIRHGLFCYRGIIGIKHQEHIAAPENPGDLNIIIIDLGSFAGSYGAVSVEVVIHPLSHISRGYD